MLRDKDIWYAKPATFNDPFDMRMKPRKTEPAEYRTFLQWFGEKRGLRGAKLLEYVNSCFVGGRIKPEQLKRMEEAEASADEMISNVGVLSLSTRNDSILMWSHYAGEHKGFCLEFSDMADNEHGQRAIQVKYSKDFPVFSSIEVINGTFGRELFLTKYDDWSYENEWRIINNTGNISLPFPGRLSSVIFGLNMAEDDKTRIKEILRDDKDVTYKQAVRTESQFSLNVIDVA